MTVEIAEATPRATISVGRPQLVVALRGDTTVDLPIVVRRPTLRDAQRTRNVLRAGQRDPAKFIVALEVEVAIAAHPASARASVSALESGPRGQAGTRPSGTETVRYIGSSHGLIGLIRDIYAAEVADAVILTPLDGSATEVRIREEIIPAFAS
ncbi:hypothetical protein GII30_19260 [Gordonia amarae]|uniref:Uncharacterized protein n=2 Tax=Gordonia amarae TaxID=36821 RepID=G7GVZ5_9ACTN|nr:hypothetical protein [Gordonia amarae]MCS3880575.1 hypothetical protein [Gordonia amarae]QHN18896.1 hypothetical protein GII35_19620 [Gordonia amarae]QHN23371.1 hypothetical protein GII34_19120 [Gordonia amarae]QHN32271.1 hypothetical protein GII32_19430 [Gordonia amarae]QHN41019.1 hypothetical protein GII30_19260 [Gordonia amarae]